MSVISRINVPTSAFGNISRAPGVPIQDRTAVTNFAYEMMGITWGSPAANDFLGRCDGTVAGIVRDRHRFR